jgi:hypothetical protein
MTTSGPKPLITHIGLGDNIVQTGLACALAEHHGAIAFPAYQQYETSVRSFFVNEPRVTVYTLPHRLGWDWGSPPDEIYNHWINEYGMDPSDAIRAGVYAGRGLDTDFTHSFYSHAGIPYDCRWSKCPLPEAAAKVEQLPIEFPSNRKIFMHDDPSRNFFIRKMINRGEAFAPDPGNVTRSILSYVGLILAASEIHVIDSAFFHLINSLPHVRAQLFMHQYARWPRPLSFRYPSRLAWNYVPFA